MQCCTAQGMAAEVGGQSCRITRYSYEALRTEDIKCWEYDVESMRSVRKSEIRWDPSTVPDRRRTESDHGCRPFHAPVAEGSIERDNRAGEVDLNVYRIAFTEAHGGWDEQLIVACKEGAEQLSCLEGSRPRWD